ncbi:MAG: hypothetical protein AAF902_22740 [Chloroflexota bacterium]
MLKKQVFVGRINGTELYVHISLILSTILAWATVTLITKPALGFEYNLFLYGCIALIAAVITLTVKVGYEIGRLVMLQNNGMQIDQLLLIPLSGLMIYEQDPPQQSLGFWSSFVPTLPIIGMVGAFTLLTLSPTASEFQIVVLRGISLVIVFFIGARLLGNFSVDRLNTVHSLVWRFTQNLNLADIVHVTWRSLSILGILLAAVAVSPTYRWLGGALALSIAWGLYDAIFYQRESELQSRIEKLKAIKLSKQGSRIPT